MGDAISGFGTYRHRYDSGRGGERSPVWSAPWAHSLVFYPAGGLDVHAAPWERLGPHKRGVGCLHLKRLVDVDHAALR